jgi:chromosome segregation ATPase
LGGEPPLVDFHALREAVVVMKSNYLHLLSDRDHLLMLGEMYHDVLKGKEEEVDRFNQELENTHDSLKRTQKALQESEMQVEQLCVEFSLVHPSSSTVDSESYKTTISQEDVSGIYYLMEEPRVMVEHEEHSCL